VYVFRVTIARRHLHPNQIILLSFLAAILAGTLLLLLPAASTDEPLPLIDALFTATSAVCVTGLTVVDTGSSLTLFGQLIILILMQLGGIGIMTIGTFFLVVLAGRVGWRSRYLISETIAFDYRDDLWRLLRSVLLITLIVESIGAFLLTLRFIRDMPFAEALYQAVFHSVSAFCNAGFSLNANSFEGYVTDPIVNLTLIGLIVVGGLGFLVIFDLYKWFIIRRNGSPVERRLSFHSRVALIFTAILLLVGTVFFLGFEWSDTLAGLHPHEKLLASLFQSVTARTAGFNTIPIGHTSNATLFLLLLLMFIGGAPGSCAGGIKVTTFGVLLVLAFNRLRGNQDAIIFGRRISEASISKAMAIFTLGVVVVVLFAFFLLTIEVGAISFDLTRGEFIQLLFEAVSAFGTVGLSTGITPALSGVGRLIITLLMFIGRLGPLTVAVAVAARIQRTLIRYPEEKVMVG
jgi:trk system potassium uptake protein TrkH